MIVPDVCDVDLVAMLPRHRSNEAQILLRRLAMMRYQLSSAHLSQYNALRDVSTIQTVLDSLQKVADDEESELVLKVHFQKEEGCSDEED